MILLPYAHERQTVQRLPYVTFGLIALNFIIFLFTTFGGSSGDADNYLYDFQEYLYSHPYLEIPEKMNKFFEPEELEQLQILKEATDTSNISEITILQEQQHLMSLANKVLDALDEDPYRKYGYIPGDAKISSLLTCMFLHGGWLHLFGNMFFLYLAGCSIEDLWGRPLYTGFYLISGIAATLTHELKFPDSPVPLVGASGAIAGLMGAFLVRLYNTKISFFYMLGLWYRGTFKAPAFIMLPLWLLQQFWDASLTGQMASVAFWAHIGGFIFGALFALAMLYAKIEEKFIAPSIEKKVSLAQNPNFLRAMELSERGAYPEALILLEKVVRQEPNHLDAFMEMRRIAEHNRDYELYSKYTGAIFDILIRNRDADFLMELYQQFQDFPSRQTLPAKTLFGLGSFFEERQEFDSALERYEELTTHYPEDPVAMKAYSKQARMFFERYNNRERGSEAFWKSYHHKFANDQWQAALQTDIKRYNIAPFQGQVKQATPPPSPQPPLPAFSESAAAAPIQQSRPSTGEAVKVSAVSFSPPAVERQPYERRVQPPADAVDQVLLPSPTFDGNSQDAWLVVPCRAEKITLKGLILRNKNMLPGFLPWKKIRFLSVGRIRLMDPASREDKDFLVIDLIASQNEKRRDMLAYRMFSHELALEKIFPRVEQTFSEAYENFIGIILSNSGAAALPSHEHCIGPRFAGYPDITRYEVRLREKVIQPDPKS